MQVSYVLSRPPPSCLHLLHRHSPRTFLPNTISLHPAGTRPIHILFIPSHPFFSIHQRVTFLKHSQFSFPVSPIRSVTSSKCWKIIWKRIEIALHSWDQLHVISDLDAAPVLCASAKYVPVHNMVLTGCSRAESERSSFANSNRSLIGFHAKAGKGIK